SVVWAVLGFGLLVIGNLISQRLSWTPTGEALDLVAGALDGHGVDVPDTRAMFVMASSRWYEAAVLPGFVGIVEGLLVGLFRQVLRREILCSGLFFGVSLLLFSGTMPPSSLEHWVGPVFFVFCFLGGVSLADPARRSLRREPTH